MLRLPGILALGNMIFSGNRSRRNGSFLGTLFILPVLIFGGWIALAAVGVVLSLIGTAIGGVFSVLASIAEGIFSAAFSGSSLMVGIVIGLVALFCFRCAKNTESTEE